MTRDADIQGLADDAVAAGNWLATQSVIDATRIGVWWRSQDGRIAPLAVAKATRFAFAIAQAAAGFSTAQQEIFLVGNLLGASGLKPDDLEAGIACQNKLMRRVTEGGAEKEALSAAKRAGSEARGQRQPVGRACGFSGRRAATAAMFSLALFHGLRNSVYPHTFFGEIGTRKCRFNSPTN